MRNVLGTLRLFVLVVVLAFLAGCNTVPVSESVSQRQAIEIVAVLAKNGISAMSSKETSGKGKYTIEVKRSDYSQAVSLLHLNSLPAPEEPSFSELIAQKGLLPNSREMEALRLDRAMAAEIEETLMAHPSVAAAKAIVRLNSLNEHPDPGVSVILRLKPGAQVDNEALKGIVQRTVPGIKPENVGIEARNAEEKGAQLSTEGVQNVQGEVIRRPLVSFLWLWSIPEDDYNGAVLSLIGLSLLVAVVGGFVGYWYAYDQHAKTLFDVDALEGTGPALQLERPRKDTGEI